MTGKIFRSAFFVGALSVLLSAALFFSVLYRYHERQMFEELSQAAAYISHGMELSGKAYLETLETDSRVTWVDEDGAVLYDSRADAAQMENHLGREEIREALATGAGESTHESETLLEKTLYFALRLGDGSVIRVSCTQSAMAALLETLLSALFWIMALMVLLSGLISYRLSRSIVRPINDIDLDNPRLEGGYRELQPLVRRLGEQNRTIRRQMEELGRRQREFTAISDNMGEGVLVLDRKLRLLSANRSARRLLEDPGAPLESLRRGDCDPALFDAAETALSGRRAEARLEKNGRVFQVLANPVTASGQVSGAVVLLMDVTELEQREALRREFSANVSHELKTPLTSISGFAELMAGGLVPPDKAQEFAGDIYRESNRLIGLVDDILNLSRLDEGSGSFEREPVDLYALAEEMLETLKPAAEKRHVSLRLEGRSESLVGVRQILREMVYNLLDNAIKYNQEGGSVDVAVRRSNGKIRLTVSDTGIGIPYESQSRIFERFYRVDKSHSKEIGGTGLGLSIVKHGAQFHRARIELKSEPEKGSTFTVSFPSGKE